MALMMTGCVVPDLGPLARMHEANELAAKDSIGKPALSAAAWPSENWWQHYGDTQLDRLMDEALKHNPTLKMAQARVHQAQAIVDRAEVVSTPQLVLTEKNNRQLFSGHSTTPPSVAGQWKWFNETTLNASYEFDFWNKNQSAIEAAVGISHAVEVDVYTARLVLVTNILKSYLRLQQAYQQRDIASVILELRQRILELTDQRVSARIDSVIDLKQAESQIPAAKIQIAQINEAIELGKAELGALTGQGPDRGLTLSRPSMLEVRTILLPSDVPAELIGRRPDIIAQRWRVEAAAKEIASAQAQFYPNISLTAFIGMQSLGFQKFYDPASRITGIGPAFSLPIFDGGRLKSNLAGRNAEYDYAVEQYNTTVVDAVRDVVSQLVSLRAVEEQRSLQRQVVSSADDAYQLTMQRYRSGVGNYLQVLTAQLQKVVAECQLTDLDMRAIELDIALARALGGGFAPHS